VKDVSTSRLAAIALAIVAAAACRILPHPWNFTPVAAMALFGGAYLPNRVLSLLFPLFALFLSDLVLGFSSDFAAVYGSFALVGCIGWLLRARRTPLRVAGAALASSVLFFAVTNFGVWVLGSMYPHTSSGLLTCYTAAIPFFRNTVLGDLFYTAVLFGGFFLAEHWWPVLREDRGLTPQPA
jgi:hypothetical protein